MAAIDKCYLDNYNDYLQLKDWMKGRSFTTPRGFKVNLEDYLYSWNEESFGKKDEDGNLCSLPVFNTPVFVDNYLYHNCPLSFIQDWLSDRYLVNEFRKGDAADITEELRIPEYEPCTKVKVLKKGIGNNPPKNEDWWVDVMTTDGQNRYRYNEIKDLWLLLGEEDVWDCSSAHLRCSVKSIIRRILKKWILPKETKVEISSSYDGDTWILITK